MVKTKKVIEILGDLLFYTILLTAPMWFLVSIDFNNTIIGVHFTSEKTWYEIGFNAGKICLGVFGYLVFAYFLKYVFEKLWIKIVNSLEDLEEWAKDEKKEELKKEKKNNKREKRKVKNNDKNDKVNLGRGDIFRRQRDAGDGGAIKSSIAGGGSAKNEHPISNAERTQRSSSVGRIQLPTPDND
jgi:hypothetical protein